MSPFLSGRIITFCDFCKVSKRGCACNEDNHERNRFLIDEGETNNIGDEIRKVAEP